MIRLPLFLALISVAACSLPPTKVETLRPGEVISAQAASDAVAVGKSTRADVRAALGEATVVDFDSGHEVWVYRESPRAATAPPRELVLLFDPSGVLSRTRVR